MKDYIILAGLIIGIPILYWGVLQWYMPDFSEEKNKERKLFKTVPELLVLVASEAAAIKIWYSYTTETITSITFTLLYIVLVVMTILCMTDFWEKIVPNKILLMFIVAGIMAIGFHGVQDMGVVINIIPSVILGFVFCLIAFGTVYVISKGSLGSGDVKLAMLLGIFLTGEYVVKAIFYGCLISALFSIVQLLRKKISRKDELPFVPFLYIGLIITYFVG